MPRIPIDKIYMQMSYQTAKLSYAERRKVGCIIVKDDQIVSFGYNGTPHGFDNSCEETETAHFDSPIGAQLLQDQGFDCSCNPAKKDRTKREVLHAESNAIMKVAKSTMSCEGADLYTTTCPCFECSKLIIQAGIRKVCYSETYRDMSGIDLLQQAGVQVEPVLCWNDL